KFISVKATLRDESSAQLSWTAVYDKPVAYFMVERSLDGQHFTSVQQVAAQAALQVETRYEVADNLAGISAGRIYYRVKAVDAEGRSTLSAVVTVARTESRIPALSVAPNPARSVLQISLHSPKAVTARFHISDAAGRSVLQFTESLDRGHNSFSNHRIAALPAGMYYLCVLVDGKVQSVKFEVQR
ncbi:MAG TPA: T9SS type A sorting domain-containing protein, partial [Chitinophagaceae bacterium]|nr:T9SS type A sorting domain-containing protein [Chitinophagaceae bacterium]